MREIELKTLHGCGWVRFDGTMAEARRMYPHLEARYVGGVLECSNLPTAVWVPMNSEAQCFTPEERAADQGLPVESYRLRPYDDAPATETQFVTCYSEPASTGISGARQAERQKRESSRIDLRMVMSWIPSQSSHDEVRVVVDPSFAQVARSHFGATKYAGERWTMIQTAELEAMAKPVVIQGSRAEVPSRALEAELATTKEKLTELHREHEELRNKYDKLTWSKHDASVRADKKQVRDDEYNRALVQNAKMRIEIEDLKRKLGKVRR